MKKVLVIIMALVVLATSLSAAPSIERYMAPSAQYGSSDSNSSAQQAASLSEMLYALGNLYSYLDTNFLYEIDSQKMQDAVISAMIDSLGDKYSYYITPEDAQEFSEETTGICRYRYIPYKGKPCIYRLGGSVYLYGYYHIPIPWSSC